MSGKKLAIIGVGVVITTLFCMMVLPGIMDEWNTNYEDNTAYYQLTQLPDADPRNPDPQSEAHKKAEDTKKEPCAPNGCQCVGGIWHGRNGKPETHQGQPIECVEEATQEEAAFEDIMVEMAVVVNAANGLYQRKAQIDYLFVLEGSGLTHIKGIKFVRGLLSPISSLYSVAVQIGETMYWLGDWPKDTGEEIRCKAIFIPVGMMACHPINGV